MESRQELTQWVNDTLELQFDKIDQLGSGFAYCQLLDSIFRDVPLARVRFEPKSDLDVSQNYTILKQTLTRHGIEKALDPQRLAKCRLQDNLAFVQWLRKLWLEHYHGPYNAAARRAQAGIRVPSRSSYLRPQPRPPTRSVSEPREAQARQPERPLRARVSLAALNTKTREQTRLEEQVKDLEYAVVVATTERTLYYEKLLQIEQLVQDKLDTIYQTKGDAAGMDEKDPQVGLLRDVQTILYATAEGFDTPYRPEDEPF